jgi:hypothetical protein
MDIQEPMGHEEYQIIQARLKFLQAMELHLSEDQTIEKLDLEIGVLEYRLYLKKIERASWD